VLSEVSQAQKDKDYMFSSICGRQTQYKYKQYHEKQVTIREVTTGRGSVKEGT
jgi:hypothetical protein